MAVKGKGVTKAPKPAAAPNPIGRPSDYDPVYCAMVIEMGKQGKGRAEIASELDVSRQTLANWEQAHPEFLDATARARDEALAWWEGQSRQNLSNKNFNAALWSKAMGGRFPAEPYRERVQLTGKDDGPLQHVDLSKLSDEELDRLEAVIGPLLGGDQGGASEAAG